MRRESAFKNLTVLVSGSGTNLENIAVHIEEGKLKRCRIGLVISDQPDAYALKRAERRGFETLVVNRKDYKTKAEFENVILSALEKAEIDFVVLAGFMRILSPDFVRALRWRIINIHPALLPKFPGAHAIRDAWEAKVKETGVTVHFVDEGVDTGPVILQKKIAVLPGEALESLEKRIHEVEYELYPKALQLLVDGKLEVVRGKVRRRV